MNPDKVTSRQLVLIIASFGLSLTISYMFSLNLPPANQDVWIVFLLGFVYSLVVRMPLLFLISKFPELSLVEILEKILGKYLGKLIGFFYALYFTVYSIFIVLLQAQLVGVNVLSRTPNWIIIGLLILTVLYIGTKGLVLMCWTGELITPLSLISIVFLILLGLKNVDFTLLLPILGDSTFGEINKGALMFSVIVNDVFVLVKCSPHLEEKKDVYKIYIYASLIFTIIGSVAVIVTQGALGIEQARHTIYPFLIYTRNISYTSAFERIDVLFVIAWIAANTVRILFFIYFAYMAYKEVFNIDKGKVLYYVLGTSIGIVSIYIANTTVLATGGPSINTLQMLFTGVAIVIIPFITMIVYFFRSKSLQKQENTENN